MIIRQGFVSATCAAFAALLPLAASAQADSPDQALRMPPAAHCLDARDVVQMEQATPSAIAVRGGNGQTYRLDFSAACPGINEAASVRLDAPEGWACGAAGEQLVVSGRRCEVSSVQLIDNREFALTAKESSQQFAATLPTVTVSAKDGTGESAPRHTFQASTDYCFATRHVRSWSEQPGGVVVETNPRRSGGNRFYQIELAGSCTLLAGAHAVDFQSGFHNGLICGNPGDRMVMLPSGVDRDIRESTPRFARPGCPVLAVYPKQ